ncbi:hypothetical protein [Catenulispora pinisilvae]|uniref:hypothetical protein n=1 Tax=Catenulispora pinisilvae TaxID=2705253 RepID=UPI001890CC10|nr:hypothetical protein [Catenulispora pinisilvae]
MADTALELEVTPEAQDTTSTSQVGDWEVEEVLARFDKVGRDTKAAGTTACH